MFLAILLSGLFLGSRKSSMHCHIVCPLYIRQRLFPSASVKILLQLESNLLDMGSFLVPILFYDDCGFQSTSIAAPPLEGLLHVFEAPRLRPVG